ncbi:protein of unknown function [Magnetospirillum sp. XM-1]|uniref:hypothetical protein n=1 Tax=Magnetospirillum sp. XM-1 TaxID=1663591 RepID=UPI00073DD903|nr:hypothetical protein [Magnetospirillum sp. XM-1]CUW39157.1 protein of unknown function [Magnetospirillum sp. XM-1]
MTAQQKILNWKHLTEILQSIRLSGQGDAARAARIAEQLLPHFPKFSYTLNRIHSRMTQTA